MADDSSSTTRKRRFGFGRGEKDDPDAPVRSADEWVDTLAVSPRDSDLGSDEGPGSDDAGSPFDTSGLSESAGSRGALEDENGDGHAGDHARPWSGASDDGAVPRRDWRRRSSESIEEIEFYIDRVIGTAQDPRMRRRSVSARELGLEPSSPGMVQTQVEGLVHEIPIKLPFPQDEMRGARLVYETEGGYVIEITRAVGGSDRQVDRQFYTVSRVGHVEQILDRLRSVDELARAGGPGAGTTAPEHTEEDDAGASLASVAGRGAHEEPLPEHLPPADREEERFGGVTGHDAGSWADDHDAATEAPQPEAAGAEAPDRWGEDDDAATTEDDDSYDEDTDEGDEEGGKRRGFALFSRRRKGRSTDDEDQEESDASAGSDLPDDAAGSDEDPTEDDDEGDDGGGRRGKLKGLFRRRKGRDGDDEDDDDGEAADGDDPHAADAADPATENEDADEPALRA